MDRHLLGGGGYDQDNENSLAWLGEQAIPLEVRVFHLTSLSAVNEEDAFDALQLGTTYRHGVFACPV